MIGGCNLMINRVAGRRRFLRLFCTDGDGGGVEGNGTCHALFFLFSFSFFFMVSGYFCVGKLNTPDKKLKPAPKNPPNNKPCNCGCNRAWFGPAPHIRGPHAGCSLDLALL